MYGQSQCASAQGHFCPFPSSPPNQTHSKKVFFPNFSTKFFFHPISPPNKHPKVWILWFLTETLICQTIAYKTISCDFLSNVIHKEKKIHNQVPFFYK